jgi:cell division protein FtsX
VEAMMRPRWKKVFTDLWGNKLRSLLVIASITIGLFAVGLITAMHTILTQDMRTSYSSVNPANIISNFVIKTKSGVTNTTGLVVFWSMTSI